MYIDLVRLQKYDILLIFSKINRGEKIKQSVSNVLVGQCQTKESVIINRSNGRYLTT